MKVYVLHTINGWDAAAGDRLGAFLSVESAKRRAEEEEPTVTFNWNENTPGIFIEYTRNFEYRIEEFEVQP